MKFPIEIWNPVLVDTDSGGTIEDYPAASFSDFALVKDGPLNKFAGVVSSGEEIVKRFTIDNRPSLVISQKSRILFQGAFYNVTTIQKADNREFKLIIEGRAKL